MTVLAYSRPFWPLFLHVLAAMTLFGAVLAAFVTALAGRARATFVALLVAVPAWVVMRISAEWIYSKEGKWPNDPTWIGLGFAIADGGLLVLLLAIAAAWWWQRRSGVWAARVVLGLCGVYLVLLGVAWLAMSGKWG